jgi:predicted RNA-binding Zn-ribbon protein involved in translation (DUF1610 family)
MREKLIELLESAESAIYWNSSDKGFIEKIADHLVANGVTAQKEAKLYWKPVEKGVWNLTCSACDSHLGCREGAKHCPECGATFVYPKAISPKLPEEVDNG